MRQSTRVKHTKQTPPGGNHQRAKNIPSKANETSSPEEADPEAFTSTLDAIEHSLQGLAGEGVQLYTDPGTRAKNLLAIQQALGNRSVQRLVQRQAVPAPAGGVTPPGVAPPGADAGMPQDLRDFRTRGPVPADANGITIVPTTSMGGFNARYDPASMLLTITLNIGMNFKDGMHINGDQVTSTHASLDNSAIQVNDLLSKLSGEDRARALAQVREQWTWTGAGDPRITNWMATYRSNVMTAWSSGKTGIVFQGSRAGWESQLARVNVVVNTQNTAGLAPGTPTPGPQPVHCTAEIYKTPDEDIFNANVAPGTRESGTDQALQLGSGQVVAQSHLLTQSVNFANNSSALDEDAEEHLRRWIISFQATPGTPGNSISITGRSNTIGNTTRAGRRNNLDLSLARAQTVKAFLKTNAVEGSLLSNADTRINSVVGAGTTGAGEEKEWRRVDIVVGSGQAQNIAAHEFGHMLGLYDEYASTPLRDAAGHIVTQHGNQITRGLISGTGEDVGTTTGHNTLATKMGLGGSVHENNDNIMSLGSTIRPQHYATFMEALHNITGVPDWRVKP
jgi:outer membrane protein OmpA-like peptidoglycan-associated protein